MNSDLMWSDCDVALAGFSDNSGLETSISKRSKWKYHMYKFIYYCGKINISLSLVSLLFSSYSLIYLKTTISILITMLSFYCFGYFMYSAKFCYDSLISKTFNELIESCKESNKDFKDEKEIFNMFLGNIKFKTNLIGIFFIIWILSCSNFKHGFLGLLSVASGYTHAYCFFPKKLLEKYVKMDKNQIIVNSENNISSMEMGRQHDL